MRSLFYILLILFLAFCSHCNRSVSVEGDAEFEMDAVDQDVDMDDFNDVVPEDQGPEDPDMSEPEDVPVDEIPGIVCGNGEVEEGEYCDDGNIVDGDGCDSDCTFSCIESNEAVDCNDWNPCTDDRCDEATHTCSYSLSADTVVCRPVIGECDVEESCTGSSPDCPDDVFRPAGYTCSDGDSCTEPDRCDDAGNCRGVPLEPLRDVTALSAGGDHTCALTDDGGVRCWGYNDYGQLGNGTTVDSAAPVDVVGLSSGIVAVSADYVHTCALTDSGGVKCWGRNNRGQLGDGTTTDSATPVDVIGLSSGMMAVSAGSGQTCALTDTGGVKCWGENDHGELGDGTTVDRATPVDVVSLSSGVVAVSAGGWSTCALTDAGGVKCWGYNRWGQLGNGTTTDSATPVDVRDMASGISAVSVGCLYACALTDAGGLKCWGGNGNGELGDGTTSLYRTVPVDVVGLSSGIADVSAGGGWFTCALTVAGGVKCWGYNYDGQLGNCTREDSHTPVDVVSLSGIVALSAGAGHSCVLTNEGSVKCWGENEFGQLGDGSIGDGHRPVDAAGLSSGIAAVSAGLAHTCALTDAAGVKCWGTCYSATPDDMAGLSSGITAVSAGDQHDCALTDAGGVKCWGKNNYGQLGDGTRTESATPVDVVGLSHGIAAVSTGFHQTCAVTDGGGVKCWGIGYGTTPVDVVGLLSGIAAVATGGYMVWEDSLFHACALTTSGGVKCWGSNEFGELGDGTTTDSATPVDVVGLSSGITAVSAGSYHTCALTIAGGVKCWGRNNSGQLGDGTTAGSSTPVDVVGLSSGIAYVSAGDLHTCVLRDTGGVKCWGDNGDGQLGYGITMNSSTPVDIVGLYYGVAALSAGSYHTCAVTDEGGVKCWGSISGIVVDVGCG